MLSRTRTALAEPADPANPAVATAALCHALNAEGAVVTFVAQTELPRGTSYEAFVHETAQVPTRGNLHDFFNALAWLVFPHIKTRLNGLQAEQISLAGIRAHRGAVRDALTVFDENAALWLGPDRMWQHLQSHEWISLLVDHASEWHHSSHIVVFGHALLEKLVRPRKALVGHCFRVSSLPPAFGQLRTSPDLAQWDAGVASQLNAAALALKPFRPLPILGVPHWWANSSEPGFYDDVAVFRPRKQR